jgi:hypothetical protein
VLDHLTRPHELERTVLERQRTIERHANEVNTGIALAGSKQRRLRDVCADYARARFRERRRELPGAAAEIEHSLAAPRLAEQERTPAREPLGLEPVRQSLPQILVVLLHDATVYSA